VPNVVGQPLASAKARLAEAGLAVDTAEDFSRDVQAGAVAAQDPPANTQLEQGKTVKLTVSKGPQRVAVPPVIGDTVDAATDKLSKAGFAVEKQEEFNPQAAKGLVYDQAPRSQTLADAGSKVTIKVSKGRDEVVVPRVIGQPEQAAAEAVTKAGLKPDVSYEPITTVDPGWVFAQDPIPDAKADRGSTVVLRVRRDPTPAPTATATPAPARTATPATTPPPAASATGAPAAGTAAATRPAATTTPGR
jgi:serine/threonine-protein kinase